MRRGRLSVLAALVSAAASATLAQGPQLPVNWQELPPPFVPPVVPFMGSIPTIISKPPHRDLALPAGFRADVYMEGFIAPRFMMLGPGNEILLTDSGTSHNGAVYVLKGETKTALIEKLDRPYGLAMDGDWLYVAERGAVKRYRYDAKRTLVTGDPQEVISLAEHANGHWTRSLLFNRDHSKLYLSIGSRSNVEYGESPMRAAIHRYNPDGSGHEIFASGLRNVIGMRLYPGTDDLWVTVQERDEMGDDLPDDFVVKITPGGFYGWPVAYLGPHPEPRHKNKDVDPALINRTLYPDVLLGAHVGVIDGLFYTGHQFPEKYRGGMFVALHGSQNRSKRWGYNVAFIPFKQGRPVGGPEDFVSGWLMGPDSKDVWGRPTGLLQMPDGSLLISEDGGNKIYRVTYGKN